MTWRIGRRVGGPLAGLARSRCSQPARSTVGHVFINAKDAPFAVAMAVFLLGLVRAFEEYPRPIAGDRADPRDRFRPRDRLAHHGGLRRAGCAGCVGFAGCASRHGHGLRAAASRLGTLVLALIPVAIIAYAVMALVWPWAVADPLNPFRRSRYFAHFFEKPWQELFDGALIEPPDMPRSYVPTLLALKLPEICCCSATGGVAGALIAACRAGDAAGRRAVLLCVALAAAAAGSWSRS